MYLDKLLNKTWLTLFLHLLTAGSIRKSHILPGTEKTPGGNEWDFPIVFFRRSSISLFRLPSFYTFVFSETTSQVDNNGYYWQDKPWFRFAYSVSTRIMEADQQVDWQYVNMSDTSDTPQ